MRQPTTSGPVVAPLVWWGIACIALLLVVLNGRI